MPSSTSNASPAQIRKARRTLLIILAICIAPFIAAVIAFNFFPTAGRVNYGDLLAPTPLTAPSELSALKGKWVMLHFDSGSCPPGCETKLFNMRQSRTAQGREMDRIERVWVQLDEQMPPEKLAPLYQDVHRLHRPDAAFMAAFPADGELTGPIYLIDPLGNLMLRFPSDADPKRMMKDLQRLLKVSRIG